MSTTREVAAPCAICRTVTDTIVAIRGADELLGACLSVLGVATGTELDRIGALSDEVTVWLSMCARCGHRWGWTPGLALVGTDVPLIVLRDGGPSQRGLIAD